MFSFAGIRTRTAGGISAACSTRFRLLYIRGVAGGMARRLRGLSWTSSIDHSWWFAWRFVHRRRLPDAAVLRIEARRSDVLAYIPDRGEEEFVILVSPSRQLERVTSPTHGRDESARVAAEMAARNAARRAKLRERLGPANS